MNFKNNSEEAASKALPVSFRRFPKNTYSYAALIPILPFAEFSDGPKDGIVLYSFLTAQKENVFQEVRNARTAGISAFYIAGGPHPSGAPLETLNEFDAVVIGEGEETLPALVSAVSENHRLGRSLKYGLGKIAGIAFVTDAGETIFTPKRPPADLNQFPCFSPDSLWRPLEISRGCPHRCKFCQTPRLFGHRMRHRSVSEIVKYAAYYNDLRFISSNAFAYGSNGISPRADKVRELLSALVALEDKRLFFGTFPSEVRPEFVTEEMLELTTTYCANQSLSIGAQSGSDDILKEIGRGHTAEDVYKAAEICFSYHITPIVDFIIGFPEETESDQQQTLEMIDFLCRKGGEVRAHYLSPLPSTDYEKVIPAEVHPDISKKLGRLALGGKLKGTWEKMPHSTDFSEKR